MDVQDDQDFLRWSPAISVGVDELDAHHKEMVRIVNQIHKAVNAKAKPETLSGIVGELFDYGNYHFGAEESMFEGTGYPLETEHIEDHLVFREKLSELRDMIDAGIDDAPPQLLQFLLMWWTNHITNFDKKYTPYVKKV